jgi:hypothetical protein
MRLRGLFLCCLPVASVIAQSDEMLPRSLVQAVLGFQNVATLGAMYGSGPVGEPIIAATPLPAVAQRFGLPPNSRILGSVTWLRDIDVFGTAPGSIAGIREWFASDFMKRGYQPVDENTRNMSGGGFRDPAPARFAGYCHGADLLTVDARPSGVDRVEYRVRTSLQNSTCTRGNQGAMYGRVMGGERLPVLDNPANATRFMASGMGCQSRGYGPSTGTSTDLLTSMTPMELIQHYEKQLPATGWTQVKIPSDANSVWAKTDSTGTRQILVLTATAAGDTPNCRHVQMMLSEVGGRGR